MEKVSTVIDGTAAAIIAGSKRMIVLEITEHIEIESYPALRRAIERSAPAQLVVDDAGAGFANLRHILELEPDIVKLDIGLVQNIDHDAARRALVAGLCHFSSRTGTVLVAEGIERAAEVAVLRELSVDYGQGYLRGPVNWCARAHRSRFASNPSLHRPRSRPDSVYVKR